MSIKIINASSTQELNEFIKFPYRFYKTEKNWVPPLISEQKHWIKEKKTMLFKKNPNIFWMNLT